MLRHPQLQQGYKMFELRSRLMGTSESSRTRAQPTSKSRAARRPAGPPAGRPARRLAAQSIRPESVNRSGDFNIGKFYTATPPFLPHGASRLESRSSCVRTVLIDGWATARRDGSDLIRNLSLVSGIAVKILNFTWGASETAFPRVVRRQTVQPCMHVY